MGNNCLQSVQVSMAGDEEVEDTFGHHSEPTDVNDAKYNKTRKCRAELPITLHEIALLEKSWQLLKSSLQYFLEMAQKNEISNLLTNKIFSQASIQGVQENPL